MFYVDSQGSYITGYKLVGDFGNWLSIFFQRNEVRIRLVLGPSDHDGSEEADRLARSSENGRGI